MLGHVEQGGQVGGDNGIPAIAFHLGEHAVAGDAGVVDQDVDLTTSSLSLGNHFLAVFQNGNVTGDANEVLETSSSHVGQPGILVVELRVIGGDNLVTCLGQFLADCGSETTHGTGNESNALRHSFFLP